MESWAGRSNVATRGWATQTAITLIKGDADSKKNCLGFIRTLDCHIAEMEIDLYANKRFCLDAGVNWETVMNSIK